MSLQLDFAEMTRRQFGAAIDMLENAIVACPQDVWSDGARKPEFWYVAFHALFWLDLYLGGQIEGFAPPAPFTLLVLDPAGLVPDTPYSKPELLAYVAHGRRKLQTTLEALTPERGAVRRHYGWGEASYAELLLYNMRHVQHHAAQLNLMLRQTVDDAPPWVAITRSSSGTPAS